MKKILVSLVSLSLVGLASANDKFYFGAELGTAKVEDNAQTAANSLVATNGGSASVTQNTSVGTGRIFGGYKVNENADLEFGYIHSGDVDYNFAGTSGGGSPYTGTSSISVSGIDYSILLRPSKSSGYNNAFLRVGGTSYKTKAETRGLNIRGGSTSESGVGYMFGAGYDISATKDIDVRLQITRLEKISGVSGDKATVFSIGVLGKF